MYIIFTQITKYISQKKLVEHSLLIALVRFLLFLTLTRMTNQLAVRLDVFMLFFQNHVTGNVGLDSSTFATQLGLETVEISFLA